MTYYKINADTHSLYYSRVELNTLPLYEVEVTIENKVGMNDPEGETILNDLVLKGSFKSIKKNSLCQDAKIPNYCKLKASCRV